MPNAWVWHNCISCVAGSDEATAGGICILLYQKPLSATARERLKIIFEQTDGFEIARHDLRLRGPGEFLGARQSGVPMLRFADLEQDVDLLDAARAVADRFTAQLSGTCTTPSCSDGWEEKANTCGYKPMILNPVNSGSSARVLVHPANFSRVTDE